MNGTPSYEFRDITITGGSLVTELLMLLEIKMNFSRTKDLSSEDQNKSSYIRSRRSDADEAAKQVGCSSLSHCNGWLR
jgi:hypothetical protein